MKSSHRMGNRFSNRPGSGLGAELRHAVFHCCLAIAICCVMACSCAAQQTPQQASDALKSLLVIGKTVGPAVLTKNLPILLKYERPDLRAKDTQELKNRKSDLYCFLFDSRCTHSGAHSVYEKLSLPHRLG